MSLLREAEAQAPAGSDVSAVLAEYHERYSQQQREDQALSLYLAGADSVLSDSLGEAETDAYLDIEPDIATAGSGGVALEQDASQALPSYDYGEALDRNGTDSDSDSDSDDQIGGPPETYLMFDPSQQSDPWTDVEELRRRSETTTLPSNYKLCSNVPQEAINEVLLVYQHVYRPDLDRIAATKVLEDQPQGTFLVRPSSQYKGQQVLCLSIHGIVVHFLVERFSGYIQREEVVDGVRIAGDTLVFSTMPHLLAYHVYNSGKLPCCLLLPQRTAISSSQAVSHSLPTSLGASLVVPDASQNAENAEAAVHSSQGNTANSTAVQESGPTDSQSPTSSPKPHRRKRRSIRHGKAIASARRKVRHYLETLLTRQRQTEARSIETFQDCVLLSAPSSSTALMGSIRQFLNGMRRLILTQHGGHFSRLLRRIFRVEDVTDLMYEVDLLGLIEIALQSHVTEHMYDVTFKLILRDLGHNVNRLADKLTILKESQPEDIGVEEELATQVNYETSIAFLQLMEKAKSPIRKLQHLLSGVKAITSAIHESLGDRAALIGADEFLPLFIWVLHKADIRFPEAEVEYMSGLLDPDIMAGEVLKNFDLQASPRLRTACFDDVQGFLYIYFEHPDIKAQMVYKTFPITRTMTAQEAIEMIRRKLRLAPDPRDGLFEVINDEYRALAPDEQPQALKGAWNHRLHAQGRCRFVFRRAPTSQGSTVKTSAQSTSESGLA
ncbi:uncharacterized protein MONBRDRAFT_23795 [Monosiga brevicollis MX1]|uniref:SH2 domain-containing protein n=1 Tax=Monosiga brevicollis TaxID=81824 RepID=A9UUV1_MONBE|nr:uncharacterized protein MONBRDRAFT_23795 [Monosiga brevicollis MX1]EDQ90971.1 predicted protein [Monosiga brevicollis MX1]|eukprot:XP_001744268.1 hypothetical protein [Monosiga brevicollis MX1]